MLETINERIKHVLDTLYKGNVTAMAKATYIKRTTLSSIVNGRLEYRRHKTNKLYSIKIEPEAMEIINRKVIDYVLGKANRPG